ncbi:putative anion transporter 3, chloroplastic [Schistosoma japonicum]|nr:putative anion transporter 3, chloroplastic [Schistosoma japonicum]
MYYLNCFNVLPMCNVFKWLDEPNYVRRIVFLCCLANFFNAADRVIMPIVIIPISNHFGWNLHQYGLVLSSFSVGYLGSMIIGGSAARRYGGGLILSFAVAFWSFSSLVTPFLAHSINSLVILRILLGLREGIERNRAVGYMVTFGAIGQTVATLICPRLVWSHSFFIFGLIGLVWICFWIPVFNVIKKAETRDELSGQQSQAFKSTLRWTEFISHWPLWAIYIAHFSMNWSNYIVMLWLPTYLLRYLGATEYAIMLTAIPYVCNCIGSVITGRLANYLIKRQITVLTVRRLMSCIGLLGPGVVLFLFSLSSSITSALVLISLSMTFSAFNSAGHLCNHVEVAPNHAGTTFIISNILATIPGIVCGPLTAELVITSGGRWFPIFILASFINVIGAVVYISQSSTMQVL